MLQDLSQPKEEKLDRGRKRQKIFALNDESRFDQISLMDILTEENEKRKMASSGVHARTERV